MCMFKKQVPIQCLIFLSCCGNIPYFASIYFPKIQNTIYIYNYIYIVYVILLYIFLTPISRFVEVAITRPMCWELTIQPTPRPNHQHFCHRGICYRARWASCGWWSATLATSEDYLTVVDYVPTKNYRLALIGPYPYGKLTNSYGKIMQIVIYSCFALLNMVIFQFANC